jgi:hypothetical protein
VPNIHFKAPYSTLYFYYNPILAKSQAVIEYFYSYFRGYYKEKIFMFNKYGRKARLFNPNIPHMSSLIVGKKQLLPIPASIDYTLKMPSNFGMMLNDKLGCCTCAAFYHARQVWSHNSIYKEDTAPDIDILKLYEAVAGYNPSDPNTDRGACEQDVLNYLLNTGAPTLLGKVDKILAYIEVDPRNIEDVKRAIYECGLLYIGFQVPNNIMPTDAEPPKLWVVDSNAGTEGGHAVILAGYDAVGPLVISWGSLYRMTWAFFTTYVEEAYVIADREWIRSTGKTPLGMTIQELEDLMKAIKKI